jgi:hypothetical protein
MHSALTGVRVSVTRTPEHAHWLAHFCWGLHIVTAEKGKATEMSYSDVCSLVHFCRGFILWQQGTCFYVWLWYKRERTPKHSAIWLILVGYAPKSDSLVFRCSFYNLYTATNNTTNENSLMCINVYKWMTEKQDFRDFSVYLEICLEWDRSWVPVGCEIYQRAKRVDKSHIQLVRAIYLT